MTSLALGLSCVLFCLQDVPRHQTSLPKVETPDVNFTQSLSTPAVPPSHRVNLLFVSPRWSYGNSRYPSTRVDLSQTSSLPVRVWDPDSPLVDQLRSPLVLPRRRLPSLVGFR